MSYKLLIYIIFSEFEQRQRERGERASTETRVTSPGPGTFIPHDYNFDINYILVMNGVSGCPASESSQTDNNALFKRLNPILIILQTFVLPFGVVTKLVCIKNLNKIAYSLSLQLSYPL